MTRMHVRRSTRPIRRMAVFAAVLSLAGSTLALAAVPASALTLLPNPLLSSPLLPNLLASCGARDTAATFANWGDSRSYFPVANGGFESGSSGWSLSGDAAVEPGNESYFVAGPDDAHSLTLSGAGRAQSPTTCVATGENTVRLFVKSSGSGPSSLHVQAYVQNVLTGVVLTTGFDVDANAATRQWVPTAAFGVPNLLGGVVGVQNLTLVFTARGSDAVSWSVDDVYVDPFKLR